MLHLEAQISLATMSLVRGLVDVTLFQCTFAMLEPSNLKFEMSFIRYPSLEVLYWFGSLVITVHFNVWPLNNRNGSLLLNNGVIASQRAFLEVWAHCFVTIGFWGLLRCNNIFFPSFILFLFFNLKIKNLRNTHSPLIIGRVMEVYAG